LTEGLFVLGRFTSESRRPSTTETLFPVTRPDGTVERPHPGGLLRSIWWWLPRGDTLPEQDWRRRHRGVLLLMVFQLAGLTLFGLWKGIEPTHLALEMGLLGSLTATAALPSLPRRARAVFGAMALISTSALLTHFSGGYIEAHFHFFVMLGVIALYEDWVTFLLSIAYVGLHHGIVGTLDPKSVFNHPSAFENPWLWASIHAAFILWLSAALVVYWKTSERLRNRTELILRSSGAGLVGINTRGIITFANPAVADLTHRPNSSVVGTPFLDLLQDHGHTWQPTAAPHRGEGAIRADGHGEKAVEYSLTPAFAHGKLVGHVASLIDVSERKRAEHTLRRFNEELESRVRERTRELEEAILEIESFSYSVSHDLRSPLRVVRGFSELLLEDLAPALDEERRGQLEHVYKASERMNRTIESLLRLSRISRTEIRPQRVDVSRVCRSILDQLQAEDPARNVEVEIEPGLSVDADADLARVVFSNLLGNSWKFTREKPDARIEVRAVVEDRRRILLVRDNGAGFRPEDVPEMFQPFKRFHDPSRFEGTGIGLATVARILKRHGGSIRGVGKPGEGATFYFSFGEEKVRVSEPWLGHNGAGPRLSLEAREGIRYQ
jgi:PAS domain S-box-containing protein